MAKKRRVPATKTKVKKTTLRTGRTDVDVDETDDGVFKRIPKDQLNIDHDYQRHHVSRKRITAMAKHWSWRACGCLKVGQRPDGTYWVEDGQHRVLAANLREDITTLPCIVFPDSSKKKEAGAFIGGNVFRTPVKALEQFNARLVQQDPVAREIDEMVKYVGYEIAESGTNTIQCVKALEREYMRDRDVAKQMLELHTALVADGGAIVSRLYRALCYLQRWLLSKDDTEDLSKMKNRRKLLAAGAHRLDEECENAKEFHDKTGPRIWASGIVKILNHGRRHRLPDILSN